MHDILTLSRKGISPGFLLTVTHSVTKTEDTRELQENQNAQVHFDHCACVSTIKQQVIVLHIQVEKIFEKTVGQAYDLVF